MIGQLRGKLIEKKPPQILLDVQGVGYELEASMNTIYKLPEVGQELTLFTHFVVREDAQLLFCFYERDERLLFRTLIKVNGVGPKLALTILSSIDPNAFAQCVAHNDTATLIKLPGVGKKTAERLIIEMRDKLADWSQVSDSATGVMIQQGINTVKSAIGDAVSALISLGYKPQDASKAIANIKEEGLSSEELIKMALQGMGS